MSSTILVTGGGGFLGAEICHQLKQKGYQVRSFSRGSYPELERAGIATLQGDLTKPEDVLAASQGVDAIVHTAALAGVWGRYETYHSVNVEGTKNVLAAARTHGIRNLVYTSSPSVVFDAEDIEGRDESLPYASNYLCAYPKTKAQAEAMVLTQDQTKLRTVALRPHLIFGAKDPHFLPVLKERSRQGRLMFVGPGNNKVDVIHVSNAAYAHVLALEALLNGNDRVVGQKYFLGQEAPVVYFDFLNSILARMRCPQVTRRVPFGLAFQLGRACELLYTMRGKYDTIPPMTRFVAAIFSKSHYFSHRKAKDDFGYYPLVSTQHGMAEIH